MVLITMENMMTRTTAIASESHLRFQMTAQTFLKNPLSSFLRSFLFFFLRSFFMPVTSISTNIVPITRTNFLQNLIIAYEIKLVRGCVELLYFSYRRVKILWLNTRFPTARQKLFQPGAEIPVFQI